MDKLALIIAGEIVLSKDPGSSMRKWRELFGVSQAELAQELGVSPSTISDYESGRRKSPGIGVVRRLVNVLIEIDKRRGGKIVKQLERQIIRGYDRAPFENHDFYTAMNAEEFVEKIDAKVVTHEEHLPTTKIFGYTLIDSIRTITDVSVHEYMKIFGSTPQRALIFTGVTTGRSPMIALKIGRFCIDLVPAMVVLQGITTPDVVAQRIAENEGILLATTQLEPREIVRRLREFE
ncbi:MAG TPA: helix-turn-helix domain-containing protein [Euryarchaeota archaeon]|nr:helix-turn-helix domain-containing protein [Euryarchaeota archaeon]